MSSIEQEDLDTSLNEMDNFNGNGEAESWGLTGNNQSFFYHNVELPALNRVKKR